MLLLSAVILRLTCFITKFDVLIIPFSLPQSFSSMLVKHWMLPRCAKLSVVAVKSVPGHFAWSGSILVNRAYFVLFELLLLVLR